MVTFCNWLSSMTVSKWGQLFLYRSCMELEDLLKELVLMATTWTYPGLPVENALQVVL